ncbi:MAG: fibronectin type III domain-containing protein [Bacteroidota bacterium]|jgi:hypothetical protein
MKYLVSILFTLFFSSCTEVPPLEVNKSLTPAVRITVSITTENGALIKWYDNTFGDAHYRIEKKDIDDNDFKFIGTAQNGMSEYTDQFEVRAYRTYTYRVQVIDDLNTSSFSEPVQSWLSFWPPAQLKVVSLTHSTAQITWFYYHTIEKGFKVEQSINGGLFVEVANQDKSNKSYSAVQLDTMSTYAYRIYAYTDINISYADSIKIRYTDSQWQSVLW